MQTQEVPAGGLAAAVRGCSAVTLSVVVPAWQNQNVVLGCLVRFCLYSRFAIVYFVHARM